MSKKAKIVTISALLAVILIVAVVLIFHFAVNEPADDRLTVTFNSNGGSAVRSVKVEKGKTVTEPTVSKTGLSLTGWFDSDGEKFNFSDTLITEDLTLNAKWFAQVTFVDLDKTVTVDENTVITETISDPARENEGFYGWKDSQGNFFDPNAAVTENKTVSAVWGNPESVFQFILINNDTEYAVVGAKDAVITGELLIPELYRGKQVTQISMPYSYKGDRGTFGGTDITSLKMPDTIKTISDSAFDGCANLEEVVFSKNLEKLGCYVFVDTKLKNINLPSVVEIGEYCFSKVPFETIFLPHNLRKIDRYAFLDACKASDDSETGTRSTCREIIIPNSVTDIGREAFLRSGFASVIFEKGINLEYFDPENSEGALLDYTTMMKGNVEKPIKMSFGYQMFYDCNFLESLEIPASVKIIGESFAYGCTSLKTLTFEAGSRLEVIGVHAFSSCPLEGTITFPKSLKQLGQMFVDSKLESIEFENDSELQIVYRGGSSYYFFPDTLKNFSLGDNSKFDFKFTDLTYQGDGTYAITKGDFGIFTAVNLETFDFGANSKVTSIGTRAFAGCTFLTDIDLSKVTSIGQSAFSGCTSLNGIDLSKVTSIGEGAFSGCTSLNGIDLSKVTSIGTNAFAGCTSLTDIDLSGVTSIGKGAFDSCTSLTEIVIPSGAVSMGESVFSGCGTAEKKLSVRCVADAQPDTWSEKWNYNYGADGVVNENLEITWSYKVPEPAVKTD